MDATVKPLFDKFMAMDMKAVAADKRGDEMGKRLYLTYMYGVTVPTRGCQEGFLEPDRRRLAVAASRNRSKPLPTAVWVSCLRRSNWVAIPSRIWRIMSVPCPVCRTMRPALPKGEGNLVLPVVSAVTVWTPRVCMCGPGAPNPDRQKVWLYGSSGAPSPGRSPRVVRTRCRPGEFLGDAGFTCCLPMCSGLSQGAK